MRGKFEAVLFDMDGVVVDNMPLHRAVWTAFARERGLDPSDADVRRLDGRRAADIIAQLFGQGLGADEVAELATLREARYRTMLETEALLPVTGVKAFLATLKSRGLPCVLATSATPGNAAVVLERLGLGEAFASVVTAADVTRGKPDPEVYLTAAGRVGAAITNCLVVEDALPGLAAGLASGAHCLGLATSESEAQLHASGAHWTARDFLTLPTALLETI